MYTTITIVLTTVITVLTTNVVTNVIIAAITTARGKINTLTCRPFKLTMGNMFSSDTVVNSSTAKSLLLYLVTSLGCWWLLWRWLREWWWLLWCCSRKLARALNFWICINKKIKSIFGKKTFSPCWFFWESSCSSSTTSPPLAWAQRTVVMKIMMIMTHQLWWSWLINPHFWRKAAHGLLRQL